jgi:hypothetical protein
MDKKLYNAVVEQLGEESDLADAQDASAGCPGFTYYSDTVDFFKDNRALILDLVKEYADEMGQNPIDFVSGFKCLDKDPETIEEIGRAIYGRITSDDTQVPNALAWFALEEAASEYQDKAYEVES